MSKRVSVQDIVSPKVRKGYIRASNATDNITSSTLSSSLHAPDTISLALSSLLEDEKQQKQKQQQHAFNSNTPKKTTKPIPKTPPTSPANEKQQAPSAPKKKSAASRRSATTVRYSDIMEQNDLTTTLESQNNNNNNNTATTKERKNKVSVRDVKDFKKSDFRVIYKHVKSITCKIGENETMELKMCQPLFDITSLSKATPENMFPAVKKDGTHVYIYIIKPSSQKPVEDCEVNDVDVNPSASVKANGNRKRKQQNINETLYKLVPYKDLRKFFTGKYGVFEAKGYDPDNNTFTYYDSKLNQPIPFVYWTKHFITEREKDTKNRNSKKKNKKLALSKNTIEKNDNDDDDDEEDEKSTKTSTNKSKQPVSGSRKRKSDSFYSEMGRVDELEEEEEEEAEESTVEESNSIEDNIDHRPRTKNNNNRVTWGKSPTIINNDDNSKKHKEIKDEKIESKKRKRLAVERTITSKTTFNDKKNDREDSKYNDDCTGDDSNEEEMKEPPRKKSKKTYIYSVYDWVHEPEAIDMIKTFKLDKYFNLYLNTYLHKKGKDFALRGLETHLDHEISLQQLIRFSQSNDRHEALDLLVSLYIDYVK